MLVVARVAGHLDISTRTIHANVVHKLDGHRTANAQRQPAGGVCFVEIGWAEDPLWVVPPLAGRLAGGKVHHPVGVGISPVCCAMVGIARANTSANNNKQARPWSFVAGRPRPKR